MTVLFAQGQARAAMSRYRPGSAFQPGSPLAPGAPSRVMRSSM